MLIRWLPGFVLLLSAVLLGCGGGKYDYRDRSLTELETLMRSTHSAVRVGAVQALGDLAHTQAPAATLLAETLVRSEDRDMVHTAAYALVRLPDSQLRPVVPILAQGLEAATPFVQERILEAAGRLGSDAAPLLPVLNRILGQRPEADVTGGSIHPGKLVDFLVALRSPLPEAEQMLRRLAAADRDPRMAQLAREALAD